MTQALPNLFEYQDYRAFLRSVVEYRQKSLKGYSMQKFAKALGFSSHSGLAMILNGKRELRAPYLDKCIDHLNLNPKERLYFEAMIRAGKLSPAKRQSLLREVELFSSSWQPPDLEEGIRMIDYSIVQQILCLYRGAISLEKIMTHFRYPISKDQLLEILNWMREKQYIEQTPEGYRRKQSMFIIEDETPDISGRKLHSECLQMASNSLRKDSLDRREFQSYFFTMNSKQFAKLKQKMKNTILEAISEFETELDGDTVTQIHLNMFEVINRVHEVREKQNAYH